MSPLSTAIDVSVEGVTDTSSILLPNPVQQVAYGNRYLPFTIKDVPIHRTRSGSMPPGIAPFASSDMFKSANAFKKHRARRWDHWINEESSVQSGSSLKKAALYLKTPGLISLSGGMPSSHYFPFERVNIEVLLPPHFSERETAESGVVRSARKHDIRKGKSLYDLTVCLNYDQATVSQQLLRFVTKHTEIAHNPPYADWACCLTGASTVALKMCFHMFCTRGQYFVTEEYTFATAVEKATPLGIKVVGVKIDKEGMLPDDVDQVLLDWDGSERDGPKPFLFSSVPTGQRLKTLQEPYNHTRGGKPYVPSPRSIMCAY
jgi:aromatic amino acid aminotransferase I / 2-aminoadipate transaminase